MTTLTIKPTAAPSRRYPAMDQIEWMAQYAITSRKINQPSKNENETTIKFIKNALHGSNLSLDQIEAISLKRFMMVADLGFYHNTEFIESFSNEMDRVNVIQYNPSPYIPKIQPLILAYKSALKPTFTSTPDNITVIDIGYSNTTIAKNGTMLYNLVTFINKT